MSVVLAIVPIAVGMAAAAVLAVGVGFGVVGQTIAGIAGASLAAAVWEFSPLPWVSGYMSGPQRSAGFWGFRGGDGE